MDARASSESICEHRPSSRTVRTVLDSVGSTGLETASRNARWRASRVTLRERRARYLPEASSLQRPAFQRSPDYCLAFQFNNLSTLLRLIFVCAQCETVFALRTPFSLQNHFWRTDWLCVLHSSKNNRSSHFEGAPTTILVEPGSIPVEKWEN